MRHHFRAAFAHATVLLPGVLVTLAALAAPLQAQAPERSNGSRPPLESAAPPEIIAAWGPQSGDLGVRPDRRDPPDERRDRFTWRRQVVRIGSDYELGDRDAIREVFVLGGNVTIAGSVDQDVIVVLGRLRIEPTANIRGTVSVVGGDATVAAGARVYQDFVVVGGTAQEPPDFVPGGSHGIQTPQSLGTWGNPVISWFSHGLLWGRPIVPSLMWVWVVVASFAMLYLLLSLTLDGPIRAAALTLRERPVTSLLVGLLVFLLVGPVSVLLAVSIVGIAVVPFVIVGVVIAAILGRVAVMRWVGASVFPQSDSSNRTESVRSLAIGFLALTVIYMIPVLGLLVWTAVGTVGLGAAALTFIASYRRENPLPARPPRVAAVVPPPSGGAAAGAPAPGFPDEGAASMNSEAFSAPIHVPNPAAPSATDLTMFPRAAFFERLAAAVLDFILVLFLWGMLPIYRNEGQMLLLLLVAYHVAFLTWKQTTVGGIICQMRVVRVDGSPLRFADALVRGLSAIFSTIVLGLGFLWLTRDPERQAWHDRIAGTYVVKVPKNWPI
jgi:uncharacterized RDD family membrane protein YckC